MSDKKAALITGAAKRVGREIALFLADKGYDLCLHYHSSKNEIESLQDKLSQKVSVSTISCDLFDTNAVEELMKQVFVSFPYLNLLIHNASVFDKASFLETTSELLSKQFKVNFEAPFILTREFATMSNEGHVINLLDTRITENKSDHFAYLLSKKTLYELTKMASVELGPNFRVNGIAPGMLLPPDDLPESYLDEMLPQTPLRRKPQVIELVQALDFLMTNQSITGQVIYVNGGEQNHRFK